MYYLAGSEVSKYFLASKPAFLLSMMQHIVAERKHFSGSKDNKQLIDYVSKCFFFPFSESYRSYILDGKRGRPCSGSKMEFGWWSSITLKKQT